ncbi:MAG: aldolase/citrate lyase family protein [Gammaproteobacteria bacterium]|nr:aldolase/citrate lyase family protein [Gammaproteobacteria bacterium]
MYRPNHTKSLLTSGKPAYGMIHSLAHPPVAEMIGQAGFDFVVIDGEHGQGGMGEHLNCLQAVAATPATAIFRVAANDPVRLKRVLDLGVEGVLIPDVSTAAEAEAAVAACQYPPRGKRGFSAPTARAADYSYAVERYLADDGSELLICPMIETARGIENAAAIAAVEGVDVVQIGPFDLSYDLGIPGQFDHPDFLAAVVELEAAANAAGKILGGVPLPGAALDDILQRGYRFITLGADVPLLAEALAGRVPG